VNCDIDHLVIGAASLEQGVAWCEATLGMAPGPGGVHAFMGTHNRLLRIDGPGFANTYLEIIAIDPASAAAWAGALVRPGRSGGAGPPGPGPAAPDRWPARPMWRCCAGG
jgi:hypothetical protein